MVAGLNGVEPLSFRSPEPSVGGSLQSDPNRLTAYRRDCSSAQGFQTQANRVAALNVFEERLRPAKALCGQDVDACALARVWRTRSGRYILVRPLKKAPRTTSNAGVLTLPWSRPVAWITTSRDASTLPATAP